MIVMLARLAPPVNTPKRPQGGILQAAQQMRNIAPITRSKINTLRLPQRQFAQSNLQKIVQTSEKQFFCLLGTYSCLGGGKPPARPFIKGCKPIWLHVGDVIPDAPGFPSMGAFSKGEFPQRCPAIFFGCNLPPNAV